MSEGNEIRSAAHAVLDRILDSAHGVSGEIGMLIIVKVLVGMERSNIDNSCWEQYEEAMDTLRLIGESALNGQGGAVDG